MNTLFLQFKKATPLRLIVFALGSFAFCPQMQSAADTPDPSPLPISNTADGQLALAGVTGIYNSAFGIYACLSNGAANFNTGIGAGALFANTESENTGVGAGVLFTNTTGINNTGHGAFALFSNTTGLDNTAVGNRAMQSNIDGSRHTAVGSHALFTCVAAPDFAGNTAVGTSALFSDTTGNFNTAIGDSALFSNTTGSGNIALGADAGSLIDGDNNIAIGNEGDASDSNTIRVGNSSHERILIPAINNIVLGAGLPVTIDSTTGLLGVATSSKRFKENIKPMENASEAILSFNPVTFHYQSDEAGTPQFGLIAEEVAKLNPDLIVRDKNGDIYSVRYEAVNAMLLNEFLKAHKKIEQQEATIAQLEKNVQAMTARQQKQIEALTAGLQKVSAQLEVSKAAPQTVLNNH